MIDIGYFALCLALVAAGCAEWVCELVSDFQDQFEAELVAAVRNGGRQTHEAPEVVN